MNLAPVASATIIQLEPIRHRVRVGIGAVLAGGAGPLDEFAASGCGVGSAASCPTEQGA